MKKVDQLDIDWMALTVRRCSSNEVFLTQWFLKKQFSIYPEKSNFDIDFWEMVESEFGVIV